MLVALCACSLVCAFVASSGLDVSSAVAAASGGDGPGGTVSVGAGSGSSSGGSPGVPGSGGQGGGASPWTCTYTLLTLNNQSQAPGGNPAGVEAVMAELVRLVAEGVEPLESVHPSTLQLYRSLTRKKTIPRQGPPGSAVRGSAAPRRGDGAVPERRRQGAAS